MVHPEDQLVGRVLGGYRIDEILSTGPMGKVYKAFQLSVERYVALKFLASALLDREEVTEAFVEGAKAAASLNHRNIVRVHDVCREEGYLFYSMEYVGGGSFRDRIAVRPLPVSAWSGVLWGISSGLLHAQQKGVFHPQLVPEHFLFSETGEVKILNLGLAASMDPVRKKLGVRFPDWVFYSPPQSPQGASGKRLGEVFTAGCSLYHVMSGEPPFAGSTEEQVVARKAARDVVPLEERAVTAPVEISDIVGRMLARDPEARYRDFSELNDEVGLHCGPLSEESSVGRKLPVIGAVLLVLALAGYLLFSGGERVEPGATTGVKQEAEPAVSPVEPVVAKKPPPAEPPARKQVPVVNKPPPVKKVPATVPRKEPLPEFVEVVKRGDSWRFFPGRIAPPADWNRMDFDDSAWAVGPSGFGYSSMGSELKTLKTRLDDMPTEGYISVYVRTSFQLEELARLREFRLKLLIDDGFVAYLNGTEVARYSMDGDAPAFNQGASERLDPDNGEELAFDLGKHISLLRPGRNVFAIQGHNHSVDSSDFVLTPSLDLLSFRRPLTTSERAGLKLEHRVEDVPGWSPGKGPALDFAEVVKRGDTWRYFPGRIAPEADWNKPDFDDSGWAVGPSGFGYSSGDSELKTVKTPIADMRTDEYLSLYIRRSFQFEKPVGVRKFRLKLLVDDGFVAYLNGTEVARYNITGRSPAFDQTAGIKVEVDEEGEMSFDLEKHIPLLRPGRNVLAIQGHNRSLTSSDFVLTPTLEMLTLRSQLSASELSDLELELSLKAEEQVGGYLKLRDYRRALDSVRDLEFRFKGHQELETWKKKVLAGLESDLEVTLMRAENLLELGDFVKTRELIEEVNSRIPRGYEKRTQPLLDAVTIGEVIALGAVEVIASAEVAVLVAIEKGNFDAGAKVLAGIPAVPVKSLKEGIDRARMALETSRWAWEKILLGLRKYRGKRELLVPVEPAGEDGVVPALWLQSYKKPAGVEVPLVFQRKSGELHKCELIDLPLPALLAFLRAGVARNEPGKVDKAVQLYGDEAGVIGIEVLILCRKGPKSALESLAAVAEKDRGGFEEGINYLGKRLLESSVSQATAFAKIVGEEAEAATDKEAVDWQAFLESIEDLVRRHRTLAYYKEFREEIQALYTLAAANVLKDTGLRGVVAGRVKERNLAKKKGVIQLSYDFSSQDQLADFSVMEGAARIEDGLLVLSGECRLLHGNPFRDAIEVKLVAVGYTPTAPNINIALWTHEGEVVTSVFKPVPDPAANPDPEIEEELDVLPTDYLAFCLGYGKDALLREFGSDRDLPISPAFVITSGARGKRIPVISMGDGGARFAYTYWAEAVGNRIGGRQNVTLSLGPKTFSWTTNSLKVHRLAQRKKTRLLPWLSKAPPFGSVTLFTNGNENYYDYLVVEAELDPGWLELERKRKIAADFTALEAGG